MTLTTAPLTVLHRAPYGEDVTFKSGAAIEGIKVLDPESGGIYENLTLAEELDGPQREALKPGALVTLRLRMTRELVARRSASGRDYVTHKDKFRVLAVQPARAA